MTKVAVLLPAEAIYSTTDGGPVVRWVYEVLNIVSGGNVDFVILASKAKNDFPKILPIRKLSPIKNQLFNTISKLFPQLKAYLYCLVHLSSIKKCNIVHIQNRPEYSIILRMLGYKGKIVLHIHNERIHLFDVSYIQKLEKAVTSVISCSEAVAQKYRFKSENLYKKTTIIYNGVDKDLFYPPARSIKPALLFVGRLVESKGVHLLLEAYNRLLHDFPDLSLTIVGGAGYGNSNKRGAYEERLIEQIKAIGVEKIKLTGYLMHDIELPDVFRAHTVFCLPSLATEAFPMVIIEAMISKLVVVASDVGGVREALGDGRGLLVPEITAEKLYITLKQVIADQELSSKLSTRSYNYAIENFGWKKITQDYYRFLKGLEDESTAHHKLVS